MTNPASVPIVPVSVIQAVVRILRCHGVLATVFLASFAMVSFGQLENLGQHPDALTQETLIGQTLHTLESVDGKIYAGYGNFTADDGPVTLRSFDVGTGQWSDPLIEVNSEALYRFRVLGDSLFALTTDPRERSPGGYAFGPTDSSDPSAWSAVNDLEVIHFLDATSFGGNPDHLFLSGSGGPSAIFNSLIYESTDGGKSWTVARDVPVPEGSPEGSFTRFYGVADLNGSLYAQQIFFNNGWTAHELHVFDGDNWSTQDVPTTEDGETTRFQDPEYFGDSVVVRDWHSGQVASPMFAFDGESLTKLQVQDAPAVEFLDHAVDDGRLFALTSEGSVVMTSDLQSWEVVVDDVPTNVRSLSVMGSDVFFGARDSSLLRASNVVPERLVPEPIVPEPILPRVWLSLLVALVLSLQRSRRIANLDDGKQGRRPK